MARTMMQAGSRCDMRRDVLPAALLSMIVALMVALASASTAIAGPGHDHGSTTAVAGSPPSPRAVAVSEAYQFVGIAEGEVLVIYLDRFADNSTVTDAAIEVTIGDQVFKAELQKNGTFEVAAPLLKQAGDHSVLVNVVEGEKSDLLVGSIVIPTRNDRHSDAAGHTIWSHFWPHAWPEISSIQATGLGLGGLVVIASVFGLIRLSGRGRAVAASLIAGAAMIAATAASAHEGHDHGTPTGSGNGNAPQRRPDGNIFLPKPTQRLLEIRTRILQPETAVKTARFQGRIVANPNKSGVVQSTIQGRYSAPAGGVPAVGLRVRGGDLLGRVAPSFVSKESSDMAQTLAELDGQIALTRSKLGRQEQLLRTNTVSRAIVDEIKIQLDGYEKRRQDLLESRIQPEDLRAPVDGVITSIRVVSGQVVSQADQLFQIVDPSSFFVEALMFDQTQVDRIGDAVATFGDGNSAKLRFLGRSRSLQAQNSLLKFEVIDPPAELNVGTPVIVIGSTGVPATGLRLNRSSIAHAPNGQSVVFVHKEPELFEPRAVRFEAFDAETVMITAGLEAGEKVVVQNAPLVNQVR